MARRLTAAALPIVAVVVLFVFTIVALIAADQQTPSALGFDFLSYDSAVRRFFFEGGVLYDQSFDYTGAFGLFYYPPPFVLLAAPLAFVDPHLAAWIFSGILLGAFLLGVALMPVSSTIRWVIILLGGLSWPLVYAIKLGQVGPILLLTFVIGWRWMDEPKRFGAAQALGTAIKIQPALLFGWALLTGRRRHVAVGIVVFAVLALAATLVAGPSSWIDQATLLARVSKPIDTPHNMTPGRMAFEAGAPYAVAWVVQIANWGAVALIVLYATLRLPAAASYMSVVVASQLISPILWDHYALMLLVPVAWLVSRGWWWTALVPLVTSVPLLAVIPPVAYTLSFWVILLAILASGRREARDTVEVRGELDSLIEARIASLRAG